MAANTIRKLPGSRRHFWRHTTADQVAQTAVDQTLYYRRRPLPNNEVTVLALNEIAAQH